MPHGNGSVYSGNFVDPSAAPYEDEPEGFLEHLEDFGKTLWGKFTGRTEYNRQVRLAEYQAATNAAEAQKTRDYNTDEAQKTRDYNTYMSNTAVQRAAADYKAAGFNPANAIGSGASTGGVVSASGSAASASLAHPGSGSVELMNRILDTANNAMNQSASAFRKFATTTAGMAAHQAAMNNAARIYSRKVASDAMNAQLLKAGKTLVFRGFH